MRTHIIILFLALWSFSFAVSQSDYILEQISSNDGWEQFKEKNDTVFRRKEVDGFSLFALEITRILDIEPQAIFDVLLNVDDYGELLAGNNYLEAMELDKSEKEIVGYQYAKIPLIANRHYIFSFDLESFDASRNEEVQSLYWVLLNQDGRYQGFLSEQNSLKKNPVYIKNGAGLWTIKKLPSGLYENSYRLYLDPAGWMPEWLVNGFNVKNLQELFDRVIIAAEEE